MTIYTGQTTVTNSPVKVTGNYGSTTTLHMHLVDNTDNVYIGINGVTTSTGLKLEKLQHVDLVLGQNDSIYAVASSSGPFTITWMVTF